MAFRCPVTLQTAGPDEAHIRLANLVGGILEALIGSVGSKEPPNRMALEETADHHTDSHRDFAGFHPHVSLHQLAIHQFVIDGIRQPEKVVWSEQRGRGCESHWCILSGPAARESRFPAGRRGFYFAPTSAPARKSVV